MRQNHEPYFLAAAAALGIALVAGCSTEPTAPVTGSPSSGTFTHPSFVVVPKQAAPATAGDAQWPAAVTVTQTVSGQAGGTVEAGRFRVVVPPGAFGGSAAITISVPNPGVMRCDLSIDPISKNKFRVPVILQANCQGGAAGNAQNLAIAWFDPALNAWSVVDGSSVDETSWTVQAGLAHFSQYSVVDTKAGW